MLLLIGKAEFSSFSFNLFQVARMANLSPQWKVTIFSIAARTTMMTTSIRRCTPDTIPDFCVVLEVRHVEDGCLVELVQEALRLIRSTALMLLIHYNHGKWILSNSSEHLLHFAALQFGVNVMIQVHEESFHS